MSANVVYSNRGKPKLEYQGNFYIKHKESSKQVSWRCAQRKNGCRSRLTTSANAWWNIIQVFGVHTHVVGGIDRRRGRKSKNSVNNSALSLVQPPAEVIKSGEAMIKKGKSESIKVEIDERIDNTSNLDKLLEDAHEQLEQQRMLYGESSKQNVVLTTDNSTTAMTPIVELEPMSPILFVQLMAQFFSQGWVVGSSGGMAAAVDNGLLVSPSSVPKERLKESDLFLLHVEDEGRVIWGPSYLRPSACTPLFLLIIRSIPGCKCVIHTHSKYANLISTFLAGKDRLMITNQEMLKGIINCRTGKAMRNTDTLVLPIVENEPEEQELLPSIERAINEFPETSAVLVRHHGIFVWGPNWQKTKVMLECLEYLLEIGWEMARSGITL